MILWCLDNFAFKALNQNGDLTSVTRLPKDKKYHVIGDLTVTPFCLLSNIMKEMDRLVLACGQRRVYILEVVPRFFLKPCCDDPTHCANVCQHDHTAVDAGKQFLCSLADLNSKMAACLCSATAQFVSTGDILSGISNCSMGVLTDALFNCWRNDPIHGNKIAYTRIAIGLVD